ncbi:MAG: hypothetical protein KDA27_04185 [Candidatus Eisenbacteria bacterium]|uniref:Uncharacterized protein n=1 Tax=Eiseniibacteriota bacterium TaxID=2212470 RepID=A0A956NDL7_UNCEI|nr:hypothetical protein [Candidatus Eisenbacteria bacterium]MCB9464407.1 hypothetical protein [Candidatus Eisenbacteria bacterium]
MTGMELFGTWIAALLTLCLMSFLYKDNPLFRFAEALFAGVSLGYYIGITMDQTLRPNLFEPLRDSGLTLETGHLLFAGLVGLNLYTRYVPKIAWFARSSLAIYVGYYVGINMVQKLQGEVLPQAAATMVDLTGGGSPTDALNALVVFIGVLTVLIYFFFSVEHKGVFGKASRVGIWFLMLGFGAAFGYTVMGRISLLIGRINFLVIQWIGGTLQALGIGG